MDIKTIICAFLIGAAVATVMVFYNNKFLGNLVRALIKIDATSPESALTLDELGIKLTPALKSALRPNTSFSQVVLKTEDDRYYIAPDRVDLAKKKYRGKEMTYSLVLISLVIIAVAAVVLVYVFPEILEGAVSKFSSLFGGNGSLI